MTTNTKTVEIIILHAESDKVLCNGFAKTCLGGKVTVSALADYSAWQEMTEIEADALIAENLAKLEAEAKEE